LLGAFAPRRWVNYTNFLKFLKVKETFYKKFPCRAWDRVPQKALAGLGQRPIKNIPGLFLTLQFNKRLIYLLKGAAEGLFIVQ